MDWSLVRDIAVLTWPLWTPALALGAAAGYGAWRRWRAPGTNIILDTPQPLLPLLRKLAGADQAGVLVDPADYPPPADPQPVRVGFRETRVSDADHDRLRANALRQERGTVRPRTEHIHEEGYGASACAGCRAEDRAAAACKPDLAEVAKLDPLDRLGVLAEAPRERRPLEWDKLYGAVPLGHAASVAPAGGPGGWCWAAGTRLTGTNRYCASGGTAFTGSTHLS